MAVQYINNMTALWNSIGTVYSAIQMNVTNANSATGSKLLHLLVGGIEKFSVDKDGKVTSTGTLNSPGSVTTVNIQPAVNDGAPLGVSGTAFADLIIASGGHINYAAGIWIETHSAGVVTIAPGELRITTPGTDVKSVLTSDGAQTMTNKTMTGGTINGTVNFSTLANYLTLGPTTVDGVGGICRPTSTGQMQVWGGVSNGPGAYMQLFGATHTTNGRDIILGCDSLYRYFYDYSAATHYWRNNSNVNPMTLNTNGDLTITGQLNVDSIIQSTDAQMILASTTNGQIIFRPNGAASSVEQAFIHTDGSFRLSKPTAQSVYNVFAYGVINGGGLLGYAHVTSTYGISGYYENVAPATSWSFWGAGNAHTSGTWQTSDARLKSEIADCDCRDAYDKVRALKVKSYRKLGTGIVRPKKLAYDEMGWLAQEIELLIPEAVLDTRIPEFDTEQRQKVGSEWIKSSNDRTMLAHLWAAFQHQADLVEALRDKIAALEGK